MALLRLIKAQVRKASTGWHPPFLFRRNEPGVWYDPSDLNTLFQDAAGTVPVTGVEQPVRLMLDKSKELALGTELVSNGDFSGDSTGWTLGTGWTVSGGVANAGNAYTSLSATVAFTLGRTYRVQYTLSNVQVGAECRASIRNAGLAALDLGIGRTTNGTFVEYITSTNGVPTRIVFDGRNINNGFSIDNISVRELPGNHARASADARRPVLSARVNQVANTEDFSAANWEKANGVTVDSTTELSPIGTATANLVTTTSTAAGLFAGVTVVPEQQYTFSFYARRGTMTNLKYSVRNDTAGNNIINATSYYSSTSSDSWSRITITFTTPTGCTAIRVYMVRDSLSTGTVYLWGADLRITNDGTGLPAYQRVGNVSLTPSDYDTANFPLYLRFDGVDDCLFTGNIDFSNTDEVTVCAGVRKLSDAVGGIVLAHAVSSVVDGAFGVSAPNSAGVNSYGSYSRGTTTRTNNLIAAQYAAPQTAVVSMLAKIATPSLNLRHNTVPNTPTTTDQGTGNYANAVMFLGARNDVVERFNGRLYGLIVCGALTDDATLQLMEKFVNEKTRAY